jgi:hypothetical protein
LREQRIGQDPFQLAGDVVAVQAGRVCYRNLLLSGRYFVQNRANRSSRCAFSAGYYPVE